MKKFYVVGDKASKSLSPIIFNYWFNKYKINANYGYLQLNNYNFDSKIIKILSKKNTYGLNITIPFKQKIIKHLDVLDKHSRSINAVNCVSINNKIKGYNSDWEGFYKTIPKIKNIKNKNIILIGYGGAALAIHYVLKLKGYKNIIIINRTKKKLQFEKKRKYTLKFENLYKHLPEAKLIINTTPINPFNQKNKKLINNKTVISDIVYKPKETGFLKLFPNNKKIYGISMLLEQATPCFKLWFGFKPSIDLKLIKILNKKIK